MYEAIFFDFDGVLLDSNSIKDEGFYWIFRHNDPTLVDKLVCYHQENGGLSRYHKIRYFYEKILNEHIDTKKVAQLAQEFSDYIFEKMCRKELLIEANMKLVEKYYKKCPLIIVSGSDEKELCRLCHILEIDHYFNAIKGSPVIKEKLVEEALKQFNLSAERTLLIGDSTNDEEAAKKNKVHFQRFSLH